MTLPSLPHSLLLLVTLFFPLSAAYVIDITSYLTDSVEVDWPFICNLRKTEQNEPLVVDVVLYHPASNTSTTISGRRDLDNEWDRNFLVVTPTVTPDQYVIRLLDPSTKLKLQDSNPFQILPHNPPPMIPFPILKHSETQILQTNTTQGPSDDGDDGINKAILSKIIGGAITGMIIVAIVATVMVCRRKQRRARQRLHRRMLPGLNMMANARAETASFSSQAPSQTASQSASEVASQAPSRASSISRASLQTYITNGSHNTLFPAHPPRAMHPLLDMDGTTSRTTSLDAISHGYTNHALSNSSPATSFGMSYLTIEQQVALLKEKIRQLEDMQLESHQDLPQSSRGSDSLSITSETLPQYEQLPATDNQPSR